MVNIPLLADSWTPKGYRINEPMALNDCSDEGIEKRRKRLRYRSWHRGMQEMDLILGRFADANLDTFSELELGQFERILDRSDPDLYAWVSRRQPLPAGLDSNVMKLIMNFKESVHDTEYK